jgi:predicted RNA-binding Zn-ribbon protein involved in translation (DUF1610 family)
MTARARLNRRLRWLIGVLYAGMGLFIVGIAARPALGQQLWGAFMLLGFAIMFGVGIVVHFVAFRCPWCRGNLAPLVTRRISLYVDPQLYFCPYCGRSLDLELPAEAPAVASPLPPANLNNNEDS